MKTGHTSGIRCTKCKWVHESDSTAGTSFMGVELCPEHAAAPDLLAACRVMAHEMDALAARLQSTQRPGGVDYISKAAAGGWMSQLAIRAQAAIAKAEGQA